MGWPGHWYRFKVDVIRRAELWKRLKVDVPRCPGHW
jgi:hypothetical protein